MARDGHRLVSGAVPRRAVLLGGGATLIGLGAAPALAQLRLPIPAGGKGPLGLDLPQQLLALVPEGPRELLAVVEQVLALEQEADVRRLPRSILQLGDGQPLPTDVDSLYLAALPRLVALIDRSEQRAPQFADRAGGLLSRLNLGQREIPAALRLGEDPAPGLDLPPAAGALDPPDDAAPDTPDTPAAPLVRSTRLDRLKEEYEQYFSTAALRPEREQIARWHMTMLAASRERYQAVSALTGVPWYFIGAIHGLEASYNFRAHFHNGDAPLAQRTRQVPAGRPLRWLPPSDWKSSAIDALRLMGFADRDDWSLPATLYRFEAYNGFGYRLRGAVSPYLWSFSQHYVRGKFVADGRWNPSTRSQQIGAATLLRLLTAEGAVRI